MIINYNRFSHFNPKSKLPGEDKTNDLLLLAADRFYSQWNPCDCELLEESCDWKKYNDLYLICLLARKNDIAIVHYYNGPDAHRRGFPIHKFSVIRISEVQHRGCLVLYHFGRRLVKWRNIIQLRTEKRWYSRAYYGDLMQNLRIGGNINE